MPVTEDYTLVVTNPTNYDGDPFEVADRAVRQAAALARAYVAAVESARLMARNSELERQLMRDGACDAVGWEDTVEGKRYAKLIEQGRTHVRTLDILVKVAGFNPKARV